MSLTFSLISALAAAQEPAIIVTAATLDPVPAEEAPATITLYDEAAIDALALPRAADLLRLTPGVAVAVTGPAGSQTQLRIRGAEANHTLLFLDGIRFNDPASGNEARFELLTSDVLSRIEIVRGPQSALWGSEALGGVIAAETANPLRDTGVRALGEYGELDSSRLSGRGSFALGGVGVGAAGAWLRSEGIDSFSETGERDGFETLAASLKAVARPGGGPVEIGIVGHHVEGMSEYDGFDPATFRRADTLDATENRISAVRTWVGAEIGGWNLLADASYLDSANRNRLGDRPLNSSFGDRVTVRARAGYRLGGHDVIAVATHEAEGFSARDTNFFGGTDQDRSRSVTAFSGEWRARWSDAFSTDIAVRHDGFSDFADATTFRAAAQLRALPGLTLHAAYGEGIAQPTFYDLFGFFPGSFVGNPALQPEQAEGWEAGARFARGRLLAGLTYFDQQLENEIVNVFDPVTFQSSTDNADGTSERSGVEAELGWRLSDLLTLRASYTFLDADEQRAAGDALVREVRRPRHTAALFGFGEAGPLSWSASAAYVGEREDMNFDVFPAQRVTLDDYVLASLRIGYRLTPQIEAYGRVENGFDEDYEDVLGYRTAGRTIYAGVRLLLGR